MRFGVDIGGTSIKIGLVDNYEILDSYSIPTKKDTLFDDICNSILDYMKKNNIDNIEGIGFGVPGGVKNNYINKLDNVGISNVDIEKIVRKYFPNIKIASSNDANVAALGESLKGEKSESSYMVTLGTGVGGGYIIDGKVINGFNAACGEIGHMFIDYIHNYKCNCGNCGCFETVASATGVVRLAKEYYSKFKTSLKPDMSCKDVFDYAKKDDELGLYVVDLVSKYLARGLANIAATTNIEVFYIGGGVAAGGDILLNSVKKYFKEYAYHAVKDTRIEFAKLGNSAGMLGAAYIL